jgi:hypothetical protein
MTRRPSASASVMRVLDPSDVDVSLALDATNDGRAASAIVPPGTGCSTTSTEVSATRRVLRPDPDAFVRRSLQISRAVSDSTRVAGDGALDGESGPAGAPSQRSALAE